MGWSEGSVFLNDLIVSCKEASLDDNQRSIIYNKMIDTFMECDWDTYEECLGYDDVCDKIIIDYLKKHDIFYEDEIDSAIERNRRK